MSADGPFVGIDFGTSNSSVAWYNPRTQLAEVIRNARLSDITPSVVYFGARETLVGAAAVTRLEDDSVDQEQRKEVCQRLIKSVKRNILSPPCIALPGGRVTTPAEVVAEILGRLKRDAEELHFHEPVRRAVITCPVLFGQAKRRVLRRAAELSGFEEVELLEEPVAAALAFLRTGLKVGNGVFVYDLGGGTFDLAFVVREEDSFRVAMEAVGDEHCGGDDFEQALYDHWDAEIRRRFGRPFSGVEGEDDLYFLRECRRRKELLSEAEECSFTTRLPSGESVHLQITRAQFEELIRDKLRRTVDATREMLERARGDGREADTVLLIGGASEIPLVRRMLKEALPFEPVRWQHRAVAVALGAAFHAQTLWGSLHTSALAPFKQAVELETEPRANSVGKAPAPSTGAVCMRCGRRSPFQVKFCGYCGHNAFRQPEVLSDGGGPGFAAGRAGTKLGAARACHACKSDLPAGAKFCGRCGGRAFA